MSIPVPDPFMADVRPAGLQHGRGGFLRSADDAPYVSDPSGETVKTGARKGEVKRVKYGSPSNAGRLIENDVGLVKYRQRLSFLGIGMSTDLIARCIMLAGLEQGGDEYKTSADLIAVEADRVTRSWLAADRGSHGHLLTELRDGNRPLSDDTLSAGIALGIVPAVQRQVMIAWSAMLADNGLEVLAVEAACVDDRWRLAGTLDRLVRTTRPLRFAMPGGELVDVPAGIVAVLDVKFGVVRRAHLVQVASYAQSVPYDTQTETRGQWEWPVDQTHALIAHGDFGDDTRPPSIELVWLDLAAGREHGGECVARAKAWSTRDDLWSVAQIVVEEEAADFAADVNSSATDAGEEPLSSPALTPVRPHLERNPDPGADLTNETALWQTLEATFHGLDDAARAWCGQLIKDSIKHNVSFRAREQRSVRSFELYRGLIALCVAGLDTDGVLRALCALVAGETALWPSVAPGHLLGSLGATQAARFAHLVDALCAEQLHSYVDTDGTLRYSEPVTA